MYVRPRVSLKSYLPLEIAVFLERFALIILILLFSLKNILNILISVSLLPKGLSPF